MISYCRAIATPATSMERTETRNLRWRARITFCSAYRKNEELIVACRPESVYAAVSGEKPNDQIADLRRQIAEVEPCVQFSNQQSKINNALSSVLPPIRLFRGTSG